MLRSVVVAAVFATSFAAADDKKDAAKLSGSWVREAEGFVLKFEFLKDEKAKVHVSAGDNGIVVSATFKQEKDDVTLTVTKVDEKGEFPAKPKVGAELKFKLKVDGKKATLSDFKADDAEQAKPIVEGEYSKKDD
jgi:hypothetical protein